MRIYHITFKLSENDGICTGKHYHAENAISALIAFENEYPNAEFLYIASEVIFYYKN